MKKKVKNKQDEFVYLVYCNKEPIVYGIYKKATQLRSKGDK